MRLFVEEVSVPSRIESALLEVESDGVVVNLLSLGEDSCKVAGLSMDAGVVDGGVGIVHCENDVVCREWSEVLVEYHILPQRNVCIGEVWLKAPFRCEFADGSSIVIDCEQSFSDAPVLHCLNRSLCATESDAWSDVEHCDTHGAVCVFGWWCGLNGSDRQRGSGWHWRCGCDFENGSRDFDLSSDFDLYLNLAVDLSFDDDGLDDGFARHFDGSFDDDGLYDGLAGHLNGFLNDDCLHHDFRRGGNGDFDGDNRLAASACDDGECRHGNGHGDYRAPCLVFEGQHLHLSDYSTV